MDTLRSSLGITYEKVYDIECCFCGNNIGVVVVDEGSRAYICCPAFDCQTKFQSLTTNPTLKGEKTQ